MRSATLVVLAIVAACAPRGSRSPEAAVAAMTRARADNDAKAAYALLAPSVRAEQDFAAFSKRWAEQAAAAKPGDGGGVKARTDAATTIHGEGVALHWAKVGRRWVVTSGLPPAPKAATPADAIRAFLAAASTSPGPAARALMSPELVDALAEDWSTRAAAIEAALEKPGAIELSEDLSRAQLWYEPGRRIVVEQSQAGWRVSRFD